MKKDQNRPSVNKPDQTLPRSKILRGRRNFQRLFEKSTVLNSDTLQFRYRLYDDPNEGCYIGFIAPKKLFKGAVKRNKAKRLLREVYRIHQYMIQDLLIENQFGFHGAFLALKTGLSYQDVKRDMLPILSKVRAKLENIERNSRETGRSAEAGDIN
ncbi:MAG: ribonuclease P protein component [Balneolaceae bacterium]|nr:ribonuclease P protein component [Balneolaceae bacterium]